VETLPELLKGFKIGIESGDIEYACWCLHVPSYHHIFSGGELQEKLSEMEDFRSRMIQLKHETVLTIFGALQQAVSCLIGESEDPCNMTGKYFDEEEEREAKTTISAFYLWKLYLNYMFGNYKTAKKYDDLVENHMDAVAGLAMELQKHLYSSLSLLTLYANSSDQDRKVYMKKIRKNQRTLKKWAKLEPMDNLSKWHMVEGEIASVTGDNSKASDHFEKAISCSKESLNLWDEAQAYELFGKHILNRKNTEFGIHLISAARNTYAKWGAQAKVNQLEKLYPEIKQEFVRIKSGNITLNTVMNTNTIMTTTSHTGSITSSILDLSTSLKVFQTISGEMRLDKLLENIMELVVENAGAEKGILILPQGNKWLIESIRYENGKIDILKGIQVLPNTEVDHEDMTSLPQSILKYVIRTKEAVVLDKAHLTGDYTSDPYIKRASTKSIVCMPLMNQGKLSGIFYLENNLTAGIFTEDRVQLLSMLSTQAAISIENAKVYQNLESLVDDRTRELRTLNVKYQELSVTDQLTKIYNRRKIDSVLAEQYELMNETDSPVSVILFDIDKFKTVNDTYGHLTGDKVLVQLTELVSESIDTDHIFGRWGGEEFILICPNTIQEEASKIGEKLRAVIARTTFPQVDQITCSFGVSAVYKNSSIDQCLSNVDTALYLAKEKGRNRVEIYNAKY